MSNRTTLKTYFNTGDTPTENQFADLIDSVALESDLQSAIGTIPANLLNVSYGDNVRIATCIPKPTVLDGVINWSFVDDADHDTVFFNAISAPSANVLRISYPTVSRVLNFWIQADEITTKYGLHFGASVGLSYVDIYIYATYQTRQVLTFSGSTWSSAGAIFATTAIAGTTTTITTNITGTANRDDQFGHVPINYAGSNNRYVREVYAGLGYNQNKFELVDPTTGLAMVPSAGDKVLLTNPNLLLPVQTQATGNTIAAQIFESPSANFWAGGIFVL